MSSKFGRIRPRSTELAALEHRKKFPLTSNGENYDITFSRLFLIRSFSYFIMRTCIKAWMSLNLGQIPPLTIELAALERLKNRRHHFFSIAIDPILFKLAGMNLNFGQIPPLTTELAALEHLKTRCHHVISVDIDPIFFKHAGNKDMPNIMHEFEFGPDRTTDYGVSCP